MSAVQPPSPISRPLATTTNTAAVTSPSKAILKPSSGVGGVPAAADDKHVRISEPPGCERRKKAKKTRGQRQREKDSALSHHTILARTNMRGPVLGGISGGLIIHDVARVTIPPAELPTLSLEDDTQSLKSPDAVSVTNRSVVSERSLFAADSEFDASSASAYGGTLGLYRGTPGKVLTERRLETSGFSVPTTDDSALLADTEGDEEMHQQQHRAQLEEVLRAQMRTTAWAQQRRGIRKVLDTDELNSRQKDDAIRALEAQVAALDAQAHSLAEQNEALAMQLQNCNGIVAERDHTLKVLTEDKETVSKFYMNSLMLSIKLDMQIGGNTSQVNKQHNSSDLYELAMAQGIKFSKWGPWIISQIVGTPPQTTAETVEAAESPATA